VLKSTWVFAFTKVGSVPKRELFCARDHMGVKPFYYSQVGRSLIVGSAIDALRLHPDVSEMLNDVAIGEFAEIPSGEVFAREH